MRYCPQCQQTYADDSLNFCLSDGTALIPTSNAAEEKTVIISPPNVAQNSQVIRQGVSPLFAYLAIGLLALIAGGAIVAWIKYDANTASPNRNVDSKVNTGQDDLKQMDKNKVNSLSESPTNSRTPVSVDVSSAKNEVKVALNGWLQTVNNKDFGSHMGFYADRLDTYYRKNNVSASVARSENQKMFDRYSVLDMSISNLNIDTNPTNGEVVTTFDKTFNFRGDNTYFEGAVKSEFRWINISGKWKIKSEKDLRVYHVNKK